MTCKDCKKEKICTDKNKSYFEKDGDSWANWCDDFETIHRVQSVTFHGIRAVQSGYNYHINLTKGSRFIGHISCDKKYSRKELIREILRFEKLIGKSE